MVEVDEGCCYPEPEDCYDTQDNDCDGATDCADTECSALKWCLSEACRARIPVPVQTYLPFEQCVEEAVEASRLCQSDPTCVLVGRAELAGTPPSLRGISGTDTCSNGGDGARGSDSGSVSGAMPWKTTTSRSKTRRSSPTEKKRIMLNPVGFTRKTRHLRRRAPKTLAVLRTALVWGLVAAGLPLFAGCGAESVPKAPPGTFGAVCLPSGGCDLGLRCVGGLCVRSEEPADAGALADGGSSADGGLSPADGGLSPSDDAGSVPDAGDAAPGNEGPDRVLFVQLPHGYLPPQQPVEEAEDGLTLGGVLEPLAPFAEKSVVIDGVSLEGLTLRGEQYLLTRQAALLTGVGEYDGQSTGPSLDFVIGETDPSLIVRRLALSLDNTTGRLNDSTGRHVGFGFDAMGRPLPASGQYDLVRILSRFPDDTTLPISEVVTALAEQRDPVSWVDEALERATMFFQGIELAFRLDMTRVVSLRLMDEAGRLRLTSAVDERSGRLYREAAHLAARGSQTAAEEFGRVQRELHQHLASFLENLARDLGESPGEDPIVDEVLVVLWSPLGAMPPALGPQDDLRVVLIDPSGTRIRGGKHLVYSRGRGGVPIGAVHATILEALGLRDEVGDFGEMPFPPLAELMP